MLVFAAKIPDENFSLDIDTILVGAPSADPREGEGFEVKVQRTDRETEKIFFILLIVLK